MLKSREQRKEKEAQEEAREKYERELRLKYRTVPREVLVDIMYLLHWPNPQKSGESAEVIQALHDVALKILGRIGIKNIDDIVASVLKIPIAESGVIPTVKAEEI